MSYGIRISKSGIDVTQSLTDSNAKDFVLTYDKDSPKIIYAGFVATTGFPPTGSYTHNLGYVPLFFVFETDSSTSPTYFRSADVGGTATTTTIDIQLISNPYIIILQEGK